ncbi:hypothetical protein [Avibacterium avium]|uniref:hypothetical protein n=1 Tax=Avibacterium avium TaxID=751 RepID=UPI0039FC5D58
MEKLSKKITNRAVSLERINFSGFRVSDMWLGYFEAKNEHNSVIIKKALNLAYSFFKEELDSFIMISALKYSEEYDFSNESNYYKKLIKIAKKYNLIQKSTFNFENYSYGDIPLPASCLTISFDKKYFLYLARLVMGCDAILGDVCFFISSKLNIAIYPHEDIGFGVIALDSDPTLGIEFLKFCEKDSRFRVNIAPEILSKISGA